jgi:hypothetical protein
MSRHVNNSPGKGKFFSSNLISEELLESLCNDLQNADILRFSVAYVSDAGLSAIGKSLLSRALTNPDSFGISSLNCRTGIEALPDLQNHIFDKLETDSLLPDRAQVANVKAQIEQLIHRAAESKISSNRQEILDEVARLELSIGIRLKYFLDPNLTKEDDPDGISLFHAKLIYIKTMGDNARSIVYTGSHNWTQAGLGKAKVSNVEASTRIEGRFDESHLDLSKSNFFSKINYHLWNSFKYPACLSAIDENTETFSDWYQQYCTSPKNLTAERVFIMLSVLEETSEDSASKLMVNTLNRQGIYVQFFEEGEGGPDNGLWAADTKILIFIWESVADLKKAISPIILISRATTKHAGPHSFLVGTNTAETPIDNIRVMVYDSCKLLAAKKNRSAKRKQLKTDTGDTVEYFDFKVMKSKANSSDLDEDQSPIYRYFLEIEEVIRPERSSGRQDFLNFLVELTYGNVRADPIQWKQHELAVTLTPSQAPISKKPGYEVSESRRTLIIDALSKDFSCSTEEFDLPGFKGVLPFSSETVKNSHLFGRRASVNPVHNLFIPRTSREEVKKRIAESPARGELVADFDDKSGPAHIPRVIRSWLHLKKLLEGWDN